MSTDPLQDIMDLPDDSKIAVIVSVLRTTRASQERIEKKLDWVLRALWALIGSIVIGIVVFQVNASNHKTITPAAVIQKTP